MRFEAWRCANGHLAYPRHPRCRACGEEMTESIDLTDRTGTVMTWTTSTATPPGVREPNRLAIVRFTVDDAWVNVLGGLVSDDIETGDDVTPVPIDETRDPEAGIRWPESQSWSGYRFARVD